MRKQEGKSRIATEGSKPSLPCRLDLSVRGSPCRAPRPLLSSAGDAPGPTEPRGGRGTRTFLVCFLKSQTEVSLC